MDIRQLPFIDNASSRADIYTNLQGLQGIKNEENKDEAIKKVAQQFESLFVNMMMKSMRDANAVFEKDSLFNSDEAKFYRDMLDQQRALTLSHGRGLGIADAMYRQLSGQNSGVSGVVNPQASPSTMPRMPAIDEHKRAEGNEQARAIFSDSSASEENIVKRFVDHISPIAKTAAKKLGVDHLLLVAQSALETGWGKHVIKDDHGRSSNNLFNIKGGTHWQKDAVQHTTLEFENGAMKRESALFRAYNSFEESLHDYVDFVQGGERYQSAVEKAEDPEAYIQALHKAGYATDPEYSTKVLSVYEKVKALYSDANNTTDNATNSATNNERGV